MTELVHVNDTATVAVDQAAILRALKLDPRDPNTQALLLVCQRYELDPLMKHMVLISGNPYITRDGYLHVAHRSGQFDGMEVVDAGENDHEWWAAVSVWRKDMGRPFTYRGRYPKSGQQKRYGPEMAIKVAEVMALRRAFSVTGVGAADEQWDAGDVVDAQVVSDPAGDVAAQKRAVLDLCNGDRALAREAWDRHGANLDLIEAWLADRWLRQDSRPDDGGVAGRHQQPASDPEQTGGGDNVDSAPGVDGTPPPAASGKQLSAAQKAMHAKVSELVKAGVWPKQDADMLRKGVVAAITGGATDSSHDLDGDAMSDVLDALDAVAAGDLEVRRRATGEWSIDPARKRREAS